MVKLVWEESKYRENVVHSTGNKGDYSIVKIDHGVPMYFVRVPLDDMKGFKQALLAYQYAQQFEDS